MLFDKIHKPVSVAGKVIEVIEAPTLFETKKAAEIWENCRRESRHYEGYNIPLRRRLDICQLKPILPFVGLYDVLDDGRDFRFRLFGTGGSILFGQDFTGLCLSEIPGAEWRLAMYREVYNRRKPFFWRNQLGEGNDTTKIEVSAFPLSCKQDICSILFFSFGLLDHKCDRQHSYPFGGAKYFA